MNRTFLVFFISIVGSVLLVACGGAAAPEPISAPHPTAAPESTNAPEPSEPDLPVEAPPSSITAGFSTDFSKHSISYDEILSGGPPKDGIPAIDSPSYVSIAEADAWLDDVEPIILLELDGEARAYPIQILMWHEIVNDTLNGKPLVVTFCPLCNTAIAFERTVGKRVLDFGTTGRLRYSNLLMYDRQTETWWQQATGEAVIGEQTGVQLNFYPAPIISWADFKSAYPAGDVLSRETGYSRRYGENPYVGYDDVSNSPFLFDGPPAPDDLLPMTHVLTIALDGEAVAYTYDVLAEEGVINDTVDNVDVAIFWTKGTASALDEGIIASGRDIGAANAYARTLADHSLTFISTNNRIYDEQTGSEWNILGQAINGELEGSELTPIVAINHFWFSWAAFGPETRIYKP